MKSNRRRSCEENSNDEDLLRKYYEVLDKLDALSDQLRLEKVKVRALEDEIDELQAEQELERIDYTERIERQQDQINSLRKEVAKSRKHVSFEN